ncbi:MAG: hypothetical protein GXY32_00335 [Ruminococcaceae bacterium]|nr:hypothetical protein [Oscillospiraceae bacterium]
MIIKKHHGYAMMFFDGGLSGHVTMQHAQVREKPALQHTSLLYFPALLIIKSNIPLAGGYPKTPQ